MAEPDPTRQPGALERARTRASELGALAESARGRHRSVDTGFRVLDRDRRIAAAVLAGGVAYRLFFWMLALSLILGGALGLADDETVQEAAGRGLIATLANSVGDSVRASETAGWWLLVTGVFLLAWTGYMGAKALLLVHAAVWETVPPKVTKPWLASLVFTGGGIGLLLALGAARWVREQDVLLGVIATLAISTLPFFFWLYGSLLLPHGNAGPLDLVPGAALFAVGVLGLNLFTGYFLGPRLESATELYGGLGLATTILFWLYIIGRLVTGAANLNVSVYESRQRS